MTATATTARTTTARPATAPAGTTASRVSARPAVPDDLKNAFRAQPAGVFLITADDGAGPVAMTVTSVISVSAEPPLMAFSASALSSSTPTLLRAESAVIHFLGTEQVELAKLGATSGIDRFADTSAWDRLEDGSPVFHGADFWIRARIVNTMDGGGSTIVLVEAEECSEQDRSVDCAALVYRNRTWHALESQSALE